MTGPTCEAVHDCSSFTLCTWSPLPFFFPRCKLTPANLKSKDQPTRVARVSCSVYSYPMRIQSLDKTYNKQQTNQNKKKEKRNKRKKVNGPRHKLFTKQQTHLAGIRQSTGSAPHAQPKRDTSSVSAGDNVGYYASPFPFSATSIRAGFARGMRVSHRKARGGRKCVTAIIRVFSLTLGLKASCSTADCCWDSRNPGALHAAQDENRRRTCPCRPRGRP